jgi:predicted Zn-dependent peptidase
VSVFLIFWVKSQNVVMNHFSNMYGNTYIETLGGKMNAFTGKELTCFHVQILSEHLKEAIRTLKDMIFSFSISDADFDKEKQVVIQEIYRYQDNTLERVKIESLMQALGPCSYAFDILGTVSIFNNGKTKWNYSK